MTSRTKLWALSAGALALSLALAGCGGGSGPSTASTPSTPSTPANGESGEGGSPATPAPKSALSYAIDLDASVEALATLSAPPTADGSARMMASKYSTKFGTLATGGDSSVAMANAQKVLDARTALEDAIAAVETAKTDAMTAKDGLAADADPAVGVVIDNAIMDADMQIEAAQKVMDAKGSTSLASYVRTVTGAATKKLTPADKAKAVAMAVAEALAPGADMRVLTPDALPTMAMITAGTDTAPVMMRDPVTGMMFAEIVGDMLMDRQISTGATDPVDTRSVKVASIAGMTPMSVFGTPTLPDDAGVNGSETSTEDTNYKGIPGTVICGGTDCKLTEGKLAGSWYFAPTSPKVYYKLDADGTMYEPEVYAQYGHWLSMANGDVTVNTFARLLGVPDQAMENGNGLGGTVTGEAMYSGKAAGMSVHETFDSDDVVTAIESGAFTADVALTARFGAGPSLSGMISNFMGNAVDLAWKVKLGGGQDGTAVSLDPSTGSSPDAGGVTSDATGRADTGPNGVWTAQTYGGATDPVKRPTGIFGNFNAHFTDGDVAGAYATLKQ